MAKSSRGEIGDPGQDRFQAALAALVESVKPDRSILAVILCGSLSHDKVRFGDVLQMLDDGREQ